MKKLRYILLALVLFTQNAYADAHWAEEPFQKWMEYGAISLGDSGWIDPDAPITRVEAAQALASLLPQPEVLPASPFSDVDESSRFYSYVTIVASWGVMKGVGEKTFGANDVLTREQAAAVLYRIFHLQLDYGVRAAFPDYGEISEWAAEAVSVLAGNGIVSGYAAEGFRPLQKVTKAEFIVMLDRLMPEPHILGEDVLTNLNAIDAAPIFAQNEKPAQEDLTGKKLIALTFDDGPHLSLTPRLLDILKRTEAKVTFFMLGQNVRYYPDIARRAAEEGHQVASHTYSHKELTKLSASGVAGEITSAANEIEKATGKRPTAMRPPYGSINSTVRNNAGTPLILWSVDPEDWRYKNADTVFRRSTSNVRDGDIILLHDIHKTTIDAVERIIEKLKNDGFVLVTVDKLIETRGGAAAGGAYTAFR